MNENLGDNRVHIYQVLYPRSERTFGELRNVLSQDEINRADRFYFEEDRMLFTLAHAAKRYILSDYLGIGAQDLQFVTNQYGKPYIHGNDGLQFNMSHTKGCVMFAVSDNHELGIDVENIDRQIEYLPFAKHNYSQREYEYLCELPNDQLAKMFFLFYTRKESYIKALGLGLHLPLEEIPDSVCMLGTDANDYWEIMSFIPYENMMSSISLMQKGLVLDFYHWDSNRLVAETVKNIDAIPLFE